MVDIPEYKRDTSRDYKLFLEGLKSLPFPVGKNLLVDFLAGEGNDSIEKNKLYNYPSFGVLSHLSRDRIFEILEEVTNEGFVNILDSVFNNGTKVIEISESGKMRISYDKKNNDEITKREVEAFRELEEFLSGFNEEQKTAVVSSAENILCVAGAGSGKTTVLTKRIEFLNKLKKVSGEKILAVTFTRKAKEEMEKRLKSVGVEVVVETFNSFAEKILLKNSGRIYGRRTRIANYQEKMIGILKALDEINITIPEAIETYFQNGEKFGKNQYELQKNFVSDYLDIFDLFKTSGLSIAEFKKEYLHEEGKISDMTFNIIRYLDKYFTSMGLRTYSDQVKDAIKFFEIYKKQVPIFEHILVDEFQDVNHEQIKLLKILNPKNLFCVGDPRQSIFGWRGSEIKYIQEFKMTYPNARVIYLKKNYRSSKKIVNFMNNTIKKMSLPMLDTNSKEVGDVEIIKFGGEAEEFEFIAQKIISSDIPYEEIFVLARTNRQIQDLSFIFKKKGIKHIVKTEGRETIAKKGEVTLSTVHSAKGLEAELVFVVGAAPKYFPLRYSEHPLFEKIKIYKYDKDEEERRLFYVAISRAKKHLVLTYSGRRPTWFISEDMLRDIE